MKKKIALVTGGYSREAEISYQSVITVNNNIDREKFDVYIIDITPEGWFYNSGSGDKIPVDKNDFSITADDDKINFDGVLMCIHGTPGEDGKLQGYFDCIGLPYTTCDAATSALTFNKRYTVAIAAFAGIHVSRSVHIFRNMVTAPEKILGQLRLPVFVKPNNGGSSIGMSKVQDENELEPALQKALKEDDQVLIEEFIKGREFTIGVFKTKGEIITLPVTEIRSKKDFFDFEAKYKGLSEEITPAQAGEPVLEKVRAAACKIYAVFNCRGVVRIDFIYNEEKDEPFMLEVNTVPGQSAASIIPQQVKAKGWTLQQFYTALIEECWN
jgi:D-alanine-D-alanine ligase